MFDHEKFEAYQLSIVYWEVALSLLGRIPPGNSAIKEQLKRASSSISLNIAEVQAVTKAKIANDFTQLLEVLLWNVLPSQILSYVSNQNFAMI